jgi:hypothetical protein
MDGCFWRVFHAKSQPTATAATEYSTESPLVSTGIYNSGPPPPGHNEPLPQALSEKNSGAFLHQSLLISAEFFNDFGNRLLKKNIPGNLRYLRTGDLLPACSSRPLETFRTIIFACQKVQNAAT